MSSIKERLAAAKLPERSLQVCLRGDLAAERDDLERQLRDARQESGAQKRLNSKNDGAAIAARIVELEAQMAEEMLVVRVRALPRADWHKLTLKHPPKDGNEGDKAMGVDFEGFMSEAVPACVVDPELDNEDWERLNAVLSSADYDKLLDAVWAVNRVGADVPKSRLASLVMAESAAASKLRLGSE